MSVCECVCVVKSSEAANRFSQTEVLIYAVGNNKADN